MLANYIKTYPISIFLALVIIVLSLIPFPDIELAKDVPLADKWTHMVMYAGLSSVIWWEYWRRHRTMNPLRVFCGAVLAPIALSGLLELLQEYATTTRAGEWLDLLANSIGVLIGAVLGLVMGKVVRSRSK